MKTITFFSEKGGVGKSSFSIMYASWLHEHGVKVALADYNNRIARYRDSEIRAREKFIATYPESDAKQLNPQDSWPIVTKTLKEIDAYRQDGLQTPHATWFAEHVKKGELKGFDVVVCDFPGSLSDNSFIDMFTMNYLNLIVVPTEKDEMTLTSTLRLAKILNGKRNYCCFVNKAQLGLKNFRGQYMKLGQKLTRLGIPMLPDMVSYSERMTSIDKPDIIRSTFGFPDFTKKEFAGLSDLGIENLFIDITKELAKTKDFNGTGNAELSFINQLQKKDDGRWFRGSSYPEYEF